MGFVVNFGGHKSDEQFLELGSYYWFPPSNADMLRLLLHCNPRPAVFPFRHECCQDASDQEPPALAIEADGEPGRIALRRLLDQLRPDPGNSEVITALDQTKAVMFSPHSLAMPTYLVDYGQEVEDPHPHYAMQARVVEECKLFASIDVDEVIPRMVASFNDPDELDKQRWCCGEWGFDSFRYSGLV